MHAFLYLKKIVSKKIYNVFCLFILLFCLSCNKQPSTQKTTDAQNQIELATGFEIFDYTNFKILKIKNSFDPEKTENYVLHKKNTQLPDSLNNYTNIIVPVDRIIVTSTTHIPSLVSLNVVETLVGFPGLDYISSEIVRQKIDSGWIKEIGKNQQIETETVIELNPDVLVGFVVNQGEQTLENIKKTGIKVLINNDWNEKNPLGKAEWIKFFGALYDKDEQAKNIFEKIKLDYQNAIQLASKATSKPVVITGNMYENVWYLPKGDSWSAVFLSDANTEYPWKQTSGTGSLALSFEEVFDIAQNADFWIGAGGYSSLEEMKKNNIHYSKFKAFQEGKVYSFSTKKGTKGGVLYYELAPNRPDLVLKDIIKITHPELLENHELQFFELLE